MTSLMNDPWHWIPWEKHRPAFNMALDEALLETSEDQGKPVLRFYAWTKAAGTFGYFQHYDEIAAHTLLRPLIRRPTGGGLVPHDRDWTYSLAFPISHRWYSLNAQESYRTVHQWISAAFEYMSISTELASAAVPSPLGHCFVGAERDDVLWHGKKIAGAAQRRNRMGLLIQGSIQPPPIPLDRAMWERAMLAVAEKTWNVRWQELPPSSPVYERAMELEKDKYSRDWFHRKR